MNGVKRVHSVGGFVEEESGGSRGKLMEADKLRAAVGVSKNPTYQIGE